MAPAILLVVSLWSIVSTADDRATLPPSEARTLASILAAVSLQTSHPSPCSTWQGVECKVGPDNAHHVSRLAFGAFPGLPCTKTATFPPEIFDLPHLESAFFFRCFVHTETSIVVNSGLSTSSLQQLSVISNPSLVGVIPPQISLVSSLTKLSLSQNHVTGPIPSEILSLRNLVHLDLSFNFLTGRIPSDIGALRSLVVLDLSYNNLTDTIPTSVRNLGLLQKLDFSSNSLTGGIPATIKGLSSLSFLALSSNKLKGGFPVELFSLPSLQYLIMDENPMGVPLPEEFEKLVNLQELRLASSGYYGSIPRGISNMVNLTTLSLQNNNLSGEIPKEFGMLGHLYHMNLSGNLLEGIVPFDVSFLQRLGNNLDLRENPGLCLVSKEMGSKVGDGGVVTTCKMKGSLDAHYPNSLATRLVCGVSRISCLVCLYTLFFIS